MKPFLSWSASQIELYDADKGGCNRKWYFERILGIPRPQHPSAALGSQVHAEIERYLGDGFVQGLGPIARTAFVAGFIPEPNTVIAEYEIPEYVIDAAGLPGKGVIDVLDVRTPFEPVVIDWKTRGDLAYSKSEEQLRSDVQANVYARAAFEHADELCGFVMLAKTVDFYHVNLRTKAPHVARRVGPVTLTRSDVLDYFTSYIEPTVERMKITSRAKSPVEVAGNVRACNAYGGCPFRDRCKAIEATASVVSPTHPVPEITPMPTKEELKAKLLARAHGATLQAPTTPQAAAPAPQVAPASASDAKAKLLARMNSARAETSAAPATTVRPPDSPAPRTADEAKARLLARSKPVEAAAPAPAPAAEATERKPRGHEAKLSALNYDAKQIGRMQAGEMRRVIEGGIDARTVSVSPDGLVTVIPAKPAETTGTTGTTGATGPDLTDLDACAAYAVEALGFSEAEIDAVNDDLLLFIAENKIVRASVEPTYEGGKIVDLETVHAPEPEPAKPVEVSVREALVEAPVAHLLGLVLYVGCRPVKGYHAAVAKNLEDYLAPLEAAVAKDAGVDHYSMIDYGQGAPRVAALVLRDVPNGVFVADRSLPCTGAVLEVLRPFADILIVAGV